jgi:hypothetical protein
VVRLRLLLALSLLLTGCLNHFVYHPKKDPPGVTSWSGGGARVALAADYRRQQGGVYGDTLFTWREPHTLRWLDRHLKAR